MSGMTTRGKPVDLSKLSQWERFERGIVTCQDCGDMYEYEPGRSAYFCAKCQDRNPPRGNSG